MPDEIDLLRAFRSGHSGARATPPGRKPAPRYGGRGDPCPPQAAGLAPRARRLPAAAAATVSPSSGGGGGRDRRGRRRRARQHGAGVVRPAPTLHGPLATAWEPARAAARRGRRGVKVPSGQLAADELPESREAGRRTRQVPSSRADLTCPTAADVLRRGQQRDVAERPGGHELVLRLGRRRADLERAAGTGRRHVHVAAGLRASETDCAAGGLYYGHQPVYLSTTTGGHSWTVRPLPAGVGQIMISPAPPRRPAGGWPQTSRQSRWPRASRRCGRGVEFIATADGGQALHRHVVPGRRRRSRASACPTSRALRRDRRAQPRSAPEDRPRTRPRACC